MTDPLRAAAEAVLAELDIIRDYREKSGVGYLVVHIDTHIALRAALATDTAPLDAVAYIRSRIAAEPTLAWPGEIDDILDDAVRLAETP